MNFSLYCGCLLNTVWLAPQDVVNGSSLDEDLSRRTPAASTYQVTTACLGHVQASGWWLCVARCPCDGRGFSAGCSNL